MQKFLLFSLVSILVFSCNRGGKFNDFYKSNAGYYYKFYGLGEGEGANEFDFVSYHYKISKLDANNESLTFLAEGEDSRQLLPEDVFSNALARMGEGDTASFIFTTEMLDGVFQLPNPKVKFYQVDITLLKVVQNAEYLKKYTNFKNWLSEIDSFENKSILDYLATEADFFERTQEGVYFSEIHPGNGQLIKEGATAIIKYKGYFLDGKVFDETISGPFSYKVGTEGQVLPGMQIAINKMKKGGKTKIIIPSHLAFGKLGSSNGIIPPNTPVIYELEIIGVN